MLQKTFEFAKTEEEAIKMCKDIQRKQNVYRKVLHKPHYTPWTSSDGTEHAYLVWFVY